MNGDTGTGITFAAASACALPYIIIRMSSASTIIYFNIYKPDRVYSYGKHLLHGLSLPLPYHHIHSRASSSSLAALMFPLRFCDRIVMSKAHCIVLRAYWAASL